MIRTRGGEKCKASQCKKEATESSAQPSLRDEITEDSAMLKEEAELELTPELSGKVNAPPSALTTPADKSTKEPTES